MNQPLLKVPWTLVVKNPFHNGALRLHFLGSGDVSCEICRIQSLTLGWCQKLGFPRPGFLSQRFVGRKWRYVGRTLRYVGRKLRYVGRVSVTLFNKDGHVGQNSRYVGQ